MLPSTLYVIDGDEFVLITGAALTECKWPIYRFDYQTELAFIACEEIALKQGKFVADAANFNPWTPYIYDPAEKRNPQTKHQNIIGNILDAEKQYVASEKIGKQLPQILA